MRNLVTLALVVVAAASQATVITQWNFNSLSADGDTTTGTTDPSIGSGTASLVGGTTSTFASGNGSSDPAATDDSSWNSATYPEQQVGSGTAGVQFLVSTAGMKDITVSFDQRHSSTASAWTMLQYTTDGSTWTNSDSYQVADTSFHNGNTVDLTGVTAANDNPNFGVRIVSIFVPGTSEYAPTSSTATYSINGTIRYDMVTVSGTESVPEPASMAVLGLGALALARRKRK
ncbi:MAG: PEP-CTERM sorting domain-containing protein [Fimbriimonadaceae bacterium]|nr:PEP-CTERM sorting domain-containing protein [Fimbriimonadaceae bacterium]